MEKDDFFERELFRRCKDNDDESRANSGQLLSELKSMGILSDDPRLSQLVDYLKKIQRENPTKIFSINNIRLDYATFLEVVKSCKCLISDALEGQIIIPEWTNFCDNIKTIYERCKSIEDGKPADYIPQLARADPTKFGVSVCSIDGQRFSLGDYKDKFSIQSTCKPFMYGLCLESLGSEVVEQFIGREPSGRYFNEIVMDHNGQPHNPMINSGAIMSSALLLYMVRPEMTVSEKFEMMTDYMQRLAGRKSVGFQNSVYLSEMETADTNRALTYFMKQKGCFPKGFNNQGGVVDIEKVLSFYFQTCSLEMTCETMAILAASLANGGICPITSERVLSDTSVKNILSLMYSCGMYNYSGQFAFQVGLPAKSGVSGVVITVVPGVAGFATWSPALDHIGNSVRGVRFAQELVEIYYFHTFDGNILGKGKTSKGSGKKLDPRAGKYDDLSVQVVKLLMAASNGDKRALERNYLSGMDMNISDYDRRTALHLACCEGHMSCVRFLVEVAGVDINVRDRWGLTPMQEAKKLNNKTVFQYLMEQFNVKFGPTHAVIEEENDHSGEEEEDTLCKTRFKVDPDGGLISQALEDNLLFQDSENHKYSI